MAPLTIVTALYDLYHRHDTCQRYLEWGRVWGELPVPMVIFTEARLAPSLYELRRPYHHLTTIIVSEMPYNKDRDRIEQALIDSPIVNRNHQKDTIEYFIYNTSKFTWLRQVADLNPYDSRYLAWLDFGLIKTHSSITVDSLRAIVDPARWPTLDGAPVRMPDRIRMMMISYLGPQALTNAKGSFTWILHHRAAGVITGARDSFRRLEEIVRRWHQRMLDEGWYQLDEVFLTLASLEIPELFDVYYGDYSSIVVNYWRPIGNWPLIMTIGQSLHQAGEFEQLAHWCQYVERNAGGVPDEFKALYANLANNCTQALANGRCN